MTSFTPNRMTLAARFAIAVGLAGLFACRAASAATLTAVSLNALSGSFQAGQTYAVRIVLDPHGATDYTARLEVSYPNNLLSVASFVQAPNWISISPPGDDSIDNGTGLLIKTAGYPGGMSAPEDFGTITFVSKGTGSGTVSLVASPNTSLVMDANAANVLDVSAPASLSFVITPAPVPPAADSSSDPAASSAPAAAPTVPPVPAAVTSQPGQSGPQLGADAADAGGFTDDQKMLATGGVALAALGLIYLIWRKPRKKKVSYRSF